MNKKTGCLLMRMSWNDFYAAVLFFLVAPSVYATDNVAFGGLSGDLSITSGGVANYTIPVTIPNSRGSFLPSISIEYSSQVEDGELGVGFRISGAGSITRCPQTVAQDNKAGRISYDAAGDTGTAGGITDRYCLDGARLILVAGQYGYSGSEYRTEIDTQQRIIFYGPGSSAQSYFTVESKDGVVRTYGGVENAVKTTTELAMPKVASWLLHKVADRNGNFYEYQYLGVAAPGAGHLLQKISYGANSVASAPFDYEINFEYEARPDQSKKYQGAIKYINDKRLRELGVMRLSAAGNVQLMKYKIAYQQGVSSGKSRISSVAQCNKRATTTDFDCASPVQFSWTDNAVTDPAWVLKNSHNLPVSLFATGSDGSVRPKYIRFVDLNGDGINDIIWSTLRFITNSGASVERGAYINTPEGWDSRAEYWLPASDPRGGAPATVTRFDNDNNFTELGSQFVDLNGDGLVDYIYRYATTAFGQGVNAYGAYIQNRTANGATSSRWTYKAKYEPPANIFFYGLDAGVTAPHFVDVNGDGLLDLLFRGSGYTGNYTDLNNSSALINTPSATGSTYWIADASYKLPMPTNLNTTTSISPTTRSRPGDISTQFVDLNGDGLQDFIYYRAVNGTVQKRAYINNQYGAADNAGWACDAANNNTYTTGGGSKWVCNDAYMPPSPMYTDDDRAPNPLNYLYTAGDLGVRFVDLNNDGLQDFIYSRESLYDDFGVARPSTIVRGAYLNTGAGWISAPEFILPDAPPGDPVPGPIVLEHDKVTHTGRYFVDVSGDNLLDLVYNIKELSNGTVTSGGEGAYINTGAGWRRDEKFTPPCPIFSFNYKYWGARIDDINGDGIADVVCNRPNIPGAVAAYVGAARVDLLKSITNGFGAVVELSFSPISDRTIYTAAATSTYPDTETARPVYVVSKIVRAAETGDGTLVTTRYSYGGLKTNVQGRGSIGFESVTEETEYPVSSSSLDTSTQFEVTQTKYAQTFPYYGFVTSQTKSIRKGSNPQILLSRRVSEPLTDFSEKTPYPGVHVPYVGNMLETSYDPVTGAELYFRQVTEDIDNYANLRSRTEIVTGAGSAETFTTSIASSYLLPDSPSSWQISRLDAQTTTYHRSSVNTDVVRKRGLTYFSNGLVKDDIQEPDDLLYKLTKTFAYDAFGNVTSRVVSGVGASIDVYAAGNAASGARSSGIDARTEAFAYLSGPGYSEGVFPSSYTNAKGQTTAYAYDPITGKQLSETDANGVKSVFLRDAFGLELAHKKEVGVSSRVLSTSQYDKCTVALGCEADEGYRIAITPMSSATAYVYYDRLGRERRRVTKAYTADPVLGDMVVAAVGYDARGAKVCESRPMPGTVPSAWQSCGGSGGTTKWTRYQYDGAGRQILKKEPTGNTVTTYSGFTTQSLNALSQTRSELRNALGETVSITDAAGSVVSFAHDAAGSVLAANGPLNSSIVYTYDNLGRKWTMVDPDLGTWTYAYNVAGEMIRQKDGKNQVTEFYYDTLGRLYRREEADLISNWTFDAASNGLGKLAQSSATNGYQKVLSYDGWGRLVQTSTQVDNINYVMGTDYDDSDRVIATTYPTGVGYKNVYDGNGYLSEVRGKISNTLYWQATSRDAEGHITRESLGNGLVTDRKYKADTNYLDTVQTGILSGGTLNANVQNDAYSFNELGNLTTRSQYFGNISLTESFAYDNLNRLKTATLLGGGIKTAAYDAIGNITNRSDVGDYSYVGCGGVHRVCNVGFGDLIQYDDNGNMTSGNGRSLTWTSYNYPLQITKGSSAEEFLYTPERERVRRISTENGQETTTVYLNPRIDLGNTFEVTYKPDSTVEYTHYLYAGGQVIGSVVTGNPANPVVPELRYFHKDHLGSIMAVSDAAGTVMERLSYDAWGKRRYPDSSDDMCSALGGESAAHGFTLHEHLDGVDLVHMNGRVFDSLIGRFLSADPNVYYPDNTQDYNRYSYVWNNPLSLTDPDGFAVNYCSPYDQMYSVGSSYGVSYGGGNLSSWFGNGTGQQINKFVPSATKTTSEAEASRYKPVSFNIDKGVDVASGAYDMSARAQTVFDGALARGDVLGALKAMPNLVMANTTADFAGLGQGMLAVFNSPYAATRGFATGDYNSAAIHSTETALIFGGVRFGQGLASQRIGVPSGLPTEIHGGQQGKHIIGHNNYVPGRSPLANGVNPQSLLDGVHSGQYQIIRVTPRGQPVVNFRAPIGLYEGVPTNFGIIHSGKKGAHIVPANPMQH